MSFIQGSLESSKWLGSVHGHFDAVISARALHRFTESLPRWWSTAGFGFKLSFNRSNCSTRWL
jgi:hypothetical protein